MTLLSCFSASGLGLGIVFSVVFFRSKYTYHNLHIIVYIIICIIQLSGVLCNILLIINTEV